MGQPVQSQQPNPLLANPRPLISLGLISSPSYSTCSQKLWFQVSDLLSSNHHSHVRSEPENGYFFISPSQCKSAFPIKMLKPIFL